MPEKLPARILGLIWHFELKLVEIKIEYKNRMKTVP